MGVGRSRAFLPRFRLFGVIAKTRGIDLRITVGDYRNKLRLDVREWVEARIGDPDSAIATPKGINIGVEHLPRFLHLLNDIAREARAAGRLKPEDFKRAGLPDPCPELNGSTAAKTP